MSVEAGGGYLASKPPLPIPDGWYLVPGGPRSNYQFSAKQGSGDWVWWVFLQDGKIISLQNENPAFVPPISPRKTIIYSGMGGEDWWIQTQEKGWGIDLWKTLMDEYGDPWADELIIGEPDA